MKDQRHLYRAADRPDPVKIQPGFSDIDSMGVSHGDSKGAASCSLCEINGILYGSIIFFIDNIIQAGTASHVSELRFHVHTEHLGHSHHRTGELHIFFIGQYRTIHHDGRKAVSDPSHRDFI